jgi:DNA-binding LacI/PurR family transcriptional regulator
MGKKLKNKDLANRLGVSGTLVSLVLNNKADQHGIRKDTQERVLSLARQMGFFDMHQQEKEKASPIEETPGVIGMIVPTLHDPFIYGIAPYLQKAFSSIGIGFSIITKDPDDQRYNRLIGAFRKFYSGLILVGEAADDPTIRSLRGNDYPLVLLEKNMDNLRLNTVTTDTSAGADLMAAHIEKLGYKNVLILAGQKSSGSDAQLIKELKKSLADKPGMNKPVVEETRIPLNPADFDSGFLENYLRPPYRIDIVVLLHADLVYPVMYALQNRKIRVPQDLALVSMEEGIGFDLLHSPVTCLSKPLSGMALKAANMIWSEVKSNGRGKYKRQVNITPELVIRKSCGSL